MLPWPTGPPSFSLPQLILRLVWRFIRDLWGIRGGWGGRDICPVFFGFHALSALFQSIRRDARLKELSHPGGEVLADAVGRFALGQSCLNLLLKHP